jgi:hypothetical protein
MRVDVEGRAATDEVRHRHSVGGRRFTKPEWRFFVDLVLNRKISGKFDLPQHFILYTIHCGLSIATGKTHKLTGNAEFSLLFYGKPAFSTWLCAYICFLHDKKS